MTTTTETKLIIVASLLVNIALLGCHKASEGSEPLAPPAKTAADETRAAGSEAAKRTAPIQIEHAITDEPKSGRPLDILLTVASSLQGPLQVELYPEDGLALGSLQDQVLLADAATPPLTANVVVVPQAEGRFYLSVHATVDTPDGPRTRAIAIPIQIGDELPARSPNGTLKSTKNGAVISLPAKEDDGK